MGNLVSKCFEKDRQKYKEGKIAQPQEEDPEVNVVANTVATNKTPNTNSRPTAVTSESEERVGDVGAGDRKKKPAGKHRHRKYSTSDDSSDSDTSSSSDSSDSDLDIGHVGYKKSRNKVYKNRNGGNTYVSKKTIIGGNKMTIGKNANNVTVNIGANRGSASTKARQSSSSKQEKSKQRPFQCYYTESSAKEEESRQFASRWGQNGGPPGGNFIDTSEIQTKEYVFEASTKVDAARWVCLIRCPDGTGTGFRVGSRYIMTCKHVLDMIINPGYQQVGQSQQNAYAGLQNPDVYAVFNYFVENQQISERQKFYFKDIVHFMDDSTDTAVLELDNNTLGAAIPPPFTFFSLPRLNHRFSLIGHSEGKRMQINHVDKFIDANNTETQQNIISVKQLSLQLTGKDYEFQPHHILTNPNRFLFHCKFSKGASGSPGLVVLEDGRVVVVTMLLCGLPDWYYDNSVPNDLKNNWPKEYCVEQGVNFKSVYEHMLIQNPTLCHEIFSEHTETIPAPNI